MGGGNSKKVSVGRGEFVDLIKYEAYGTNKNPKAAKKAADGAVKAMLELTYHGESETVNADEVKGGLAHQGVTALMHACKTGNLEIVRKLVDQFNANPGTVSKGLKTTPLLLACQGLPRGAGTTENYHAIVELLLENDADVNAMDSDGMYPLLCAVMKNDATLCQIILKKNVQLLEKDKQDLMEMAKGRRFYALYWQLRETFDEMHLKKMQSLAAAHSKEVQRKADILKDKKAAGFLTKDEKKLVMKARAKKLKNRKMAQEQQEERALSRKMERGSAVPRPPPEDFYMSSWAKDYSLVDQKKKPVYVESDLVADTEKERVGKHRTMWTRSEKSAGVQGMKQWEVGSLKAGAPNQNKSQTQKSLEESDQDKGAEAREYMLRQARCYTEARDFVAAYRGKLSTQKELPERSITSKKWLVALDQVRNNPAPQPLKAW
jgi:ankyrin repeat protein